jgi:hypothetical protein
LFNPVLKALQANGGSSSVAEIEDFVISDLAPGDTEVSEIHRGTTTKLNYQLRWSINYMKKAGLVVNTARGVWVLSPMAEGGPERKYWFEDEESAPQVRVRLPVVRRFVNSPILKATLLQIPVRDSEWEIITQLM